MAKMNNGAEQKALKHEMAVSGWGDRKDMVEYVEKSCFKAIRSDDGGIIDIELPSLKTRFCFGYGNYATGTSEEADMAEKAEQGVHALGGFMRENLDAPRKFFNALHETGSNLYVFRSMDDGSVERGACVSTDYYMDIHFSDKSAYRLASDAERAEVIEAYKELATHQAKRCRTYWKKYGDSKLDTWTYIRD